jgi:hypothetical protein
MGRPIKSKYFGTRKGLGVAGEGVLSVTNPAGTLAGLVAGTYAIPAGSIGAPQIAGGSKPSLNVVATNSTTYTVAVVSAGSGYTSAPAITFNGSIAGGSGSATPVATLTTSVLNIIDCTAYIPTVNGGSSAVSGDIQEQVASKKYRVVTAQGTGACKLVPTDSLTAGQMYIGATDVNGSTYFVKKLTARRAVLIQNVVNGSFEFADNEAAGWTLDAASAGVVQIDNR